MTNCHQENCQINLKTNHMHGEQDDRRCVNLERERKHAQKTSTQPWNDDDQVDKVVFMIEMFSYIISISNIVSNPRNNKQTKIHITKIIPHC